MILTFLTLFVVLIGGICFLIHYFEEEYGDDDWLFASVIIIIIGGICLLISLSVIATKEIRADAQIVRIDAIRETFESARINENIHALELAAIQHKVAEKNEWIANAKFWTEHSLTNWFWSKKILEIKPIK